MMYDPNERLLGQPKTVSDFGVELLLSLHSSYPVQDVVYNEYTGEYFLLNAEDEVLGSLDLSALIKMGAKA